ncbi:MAG: peptide ABC transporter substrate-binding protein [Lachnospiraceae bacterium]|nr:peptide ABC transporter substrate-binding protein [Lachnospiraceae bacterium]
MKKLSKLLAVGLTAAMAIGMSAGAVMADGGDIYVMFGTNVMSLDTNLATDGDSFEIIADCIDGLTQMDAEGAAIPAIAESWDLSEDGCTYTFHLRDDAVWSNGEPVTAADFEFAWKTGVVANAEYGYMFSDIGNIKNAASIMSDGADPETLGIKAIDDKTLEVQLEVPVSFFPDLMYFPTFYPINQAFYEECGDTYGTSPDTFLSNGAFVLDDYVPGAASMTVVKNPDYYDADSVSLDSITYQVVGSSDQALTGFKSNNLDLCMVSGDQVSAVEEDPELADKLSITGAGYMWYLSFSQTENPSSDGSLANQNLRLAISNSIDRESLVDNYVKDGSIATYTAVPPQFAASATTSEDFSADQDRFKDYIGFNPDKAAEYYEAAKEELGTDEFQFTMIFGNNEGDEVTKVAQALKEQIEAALPGMTIDLQAMTKNERLDKMQNDDYCIALTRWGPDYADPMTYLGMWITDNANNYGFWSNADYDQLIKDCTTGAYITDYDARWDAMLQAEELVLQEAVIAPLYTKANANLIAPELQGVEFHPQALNRVYKRATFE